MEPSIDLPNKLEDLLLTENESKLDLEILKLSIITVVLICHGCNNSTPIVNNVTDMESLNNVVAVGIR